jgi:thymidylate synthase (FAD)
MGLTKGIVMLLTPEQQEEIDQLRSTPQLTLRAVAPGMEGHLYRAKPVLDHGFVRVIDYMGDDAAYLPSRAGELRQGDKIRTKRCGPYSLLDAPLALHAFRDV